MISYDKARPIFNLNLDEDHTYFESNLALLVHNDCLGDMMGAAREAIEDARLRGITDPNELARIGSEAAETISRSRVKLRENLINAGISVPICEQAAHHIVAITSRYAREARAILQKYGIDINGADNGVFLPTIQNISKETCHNTLHNRTYYDKVTDLLKGAHSKEDALNILDDISSLLLDGTFMN